MARVLLTRPAPLASPLALRLEQAGYSVEIAPLLEMEILSFACPILPSEKSVVALTSRLSLLALENRRDEIAPFLDRPCYCVGAQTAADATAFGFRDVRTGGDGDGESLAAHICRQEEGAIKILHIGGVDIVPAFPAAFAQESFPYTLWPVYKAQAVQAFPPNLEESLQNGRLDAALFFSPRTAQTYVDLALKAGLGSCCTRVAAIGLSEAVCAPLKALSWSSVLCAKAPTEKAAVSCLFHFLPLA